MCGKRQVFTIICLKLFHFVKKYRHYIPNTMPIKHVKYKNMQLLLLLTLILFKSYNTSLTLLR